MVLGFRHQQLMSAVLRCDLLSLRGQLEVMKGEQSPDRMDRQHEIDECRLCKRTLCRGDIEHNRYKIA